MATRSRLLIATGIPEGLESRRTHAPQDNYSKASIKRTYLLAILAIFAVLAILAILALLFGDHASSPRCGALWSDSGLLGDHGAHVHHTQISVVTHRHRVFKDPCFTEHEIHGGQGCGGVEAVALQDDCVCLTPWPQQMRSG